MTKRGTFVGLANLLVFGFSIYKLSVGNLVFPAIVSFTMFISGAGVLLQMAYGSRLNELEKGDE